MASQYVTSDEAAALLRVHRSTVLRWVRRGELTSAKGPGRTAKHQIHLDSVHALIARQTEQAEVE